jgi:hypothetical protein
VEIFSDFVMESTALQFGDWVRLSRWIPPKWKSVELSNHSQVSPEQNQRLSMRHADFTILAIDLLKIAIPYYDIEQLQKSIEEVNQELSHLSNINEQSTLFRALKHLCKVEDDVIQERIDGLFSENQLELESTINEVLSEVPLAEQNEVSVVLLSEVARERDAYRHANKIRTQLESVVKVRTENFQNLKRRISELIYNKAKLSEVQRISLTHLGEASFVNYSKFVLEESMGVSGFFLYGTVQDWKGVFKKASAFIAEDGTKLGALGGVIRRTLNDLQHLFDSASQIQNASTDCIFGVRHTTVSNLADVIFQAGWHSNCDFTNAELRCLIHLRSVTKTSGTYDWSSHSNLARFIVYKTHLNLLKEWLQNTPDCKQTRLLVLYAKFLCLLAVNHASRS